jgi:pimeloyl-ACP methyl ester carboxylesterase
VVAFDQAGHGRSSGTYTTLPDFTSHLLAVGRHFGPAAAVIGHSLGARPALSRWHAGWKRSAPS